MSEKYISVIIPCFNVERWIDRCVASLVNQTIGIGYLELIFVDDASTDGTMEKLVEWEGKYPESILVIHCDENHKQGAARNIGLQYASASYIGFVDSDDWVDCHMYEKMYEKALSTGADVVGVFSQREDINGKIYHEEKPYSGQTDILLKCGKGEWPQLPGGVWSGLYKKTLILDNKVFFPEDLAYEDNYWGAVLGCYVSSYYVIDEILYHYFINMESTIMQKSALHHFDRLEIEKMKLLELKRRGVYEENKEKIDFAFLRGFYINSLHMFFTRFEAIPYDTLNRMQSEVMELIPEYEDNPYIDQLNWVEQFFLKTIKMKLSNEDWKEIAQGYLQDIKLAEEEIIQYERQS